MGALHCMSAWTRLAYVILQNVVLLLLVVNQLSSIIPPSLLLATESLFHPSNPLSYFMHSMDALQYNLGFFQAETVMD